MAFLTPLLASSVISDFFVSNFSDLSSIVMFYFCEKLHQTFPYFSPPFDLLDEHSQATQPLAMFHVQSS